MGSSILFLQRIVLISLFTAFIYVLGLIPIVSIPGLSVPIVMQNMGVFLAGSILGQSGALSLLLLLVLAALGLPVLAGGRGSIAVFAGPSAGFLIAYVVSAFIIGSLVKKNWRKISFFKFFIINIFGLIILYAIGIPVMAFVAKISLKAAVISVLWYISFDVIKVVISCFVAGLFKTYYPLVGSRSLTYSTNVSDVTVRQTKDNVTIDVTPE